MNKEQMKAFISEETASLVDVMKKIDSNTAGLLFLVNNENGLSGVVTDGDIRRWIIETANLDVSINKVMNKTPKYLLDGNGESAVKYMAKCNITAVPILDSDGKIKDIKLKNRNTYLKMKNSELSDVSVIVMAGGKGTRLYPYTKILPKPLIPIGEIPIMERIINCFYKYGVKQFYAIVNYKKKMIQSYFAEEEREYDIKYVEEEQPLGTAGGISLINEEFEKPVIITNCDILIQADYADIYKYHRETGNAITIVAALKNIEIPYGVIKTKENGAVSSMEEKPRLSYLVNTGMYIVNPDLIRGIPKNKFFHMTDLTNAAIQDGMKVGTYPVSEEAFLDMGEFEEMRRMESKISFKME